ncbi:hypothetical protein M378DRAFT_165194 [Amanita muscaria Koide BX008]|uniref:Uncharacterized protein n=1 Tax=Amanita muscaria (strain Koide BX008) TaxID=946122 RepID=A0A0C2T8G2_AMAMK|nr:hypothetical protein M378DRAFT_165194 [Amanita muscaria Koide BX008]
MEGACSSLPLMGRLRRIVGHTVWRGVIPRTPAWYGEPQFSGGGNGFGEKVAGLVEVEVGRGCERSRDHELWRRSRQRWKVRL